MLTAMKLIGKIEDIAAYHSREENYYYSQAGQVEELLASNGMPFQVTESLSYVKVNGNLCKNLGLIETDTISEETFSNLLAGKNQFGDKIVKEHKVHGIDLTFSAPKSISIQGLVFKDKNIIEAHDKAVFETMKEIEASHSYSRPNSRESIDSGKMLFVSIRDGYSREHDPHLHTHCVVMNVTEANGKYTALDMKKVFNGDFNKTFGAIYRSKLAARLNELGYGITYTKKGEFRLDRIPQEMDVEFSTRHRQIVEAKTKASDIDAWRKTRADKDPFVKKEAILNNWKERVNKTYEALKENSVMSNEAIEFMSNKQNEPMNEQGIGLMEKILRERALTERENWAEQAQFSVEAAQERKGREKLKETDKWQLALRRATDKSAIVTDKQIITEYLSEELRTEQWKALTYEEAIMRFKQQVFEGQILVKPVNYTDETGKIIKVVNYYTSAEMVEIEKAYFNYAGVSRSENWKGTEEKADVFVAEYQKTAKRKLSEVQYKGVLDTIKSKTFLTMIQGDAGAGKTTALKAVNEYYKSLNMEVVGLAMQGVAAKNLADEAGLKGMTLASYLSQKPENGQADKSASPQNKPKSKVILFDEASMLDSRNAAALFNKAKENGDKVILIGDINQLGAIGAGKPFERLVKDAETAGDLVTFNENYRQRDPDLREAVDYAKKGEMAESLAIIEGKENGITEIQDRLDRRTKVASLYNEDTLIITSTKAAKEELNQMIRERLLEEGTLDKDSQRLFDLTVLDEDGVETPKQAYLAVNEKIMFIKNEYKEYDIRNGERATIVDIADSVLTVKTEDEREFKIDTKEYPYIIDYGYAMTTYKAQGQTYDKVVIDADTSVPTLNDMRNAYVNITRARESVQIYTDDKDYLVELAEERYNEKDTLGIIEIKTIERDKKAEKEAEVKQEKLVTKDKQKSFQKER